MKVVRFFPCEMYFEKVADDYGFKAALGAPTSGPMFTVLPNSSWSHRTNRFHPFSQQQPRLYRPHLNVFTKERSPSPPQVGPHISCLLPELLDIIFSYLDVKSKGAAARVCKSWKEALDYKSVWRNVEAKLYLHRLDLAFVDCLNRRGIKSIQILSLHESFCNVIQGIENLTSLNLSGCYNVKDDHLLNAFVDLKPTLLYLNLSLCKQITDKSVLHLVRLCANLETLELGGCSNLTNASLEAVATYLKTLKNLNLRSCWKIMNHGIRHITGQTEEFPGNLDLNMLGLQDCQHLSDDALMYISQGLTNLNSIDLSFCINISDIGLKYLAKMTTLRELNLHSCDNVSDAGLSFLAEAASPITTLNVSFCDKITDLSFEYISQGLFNLKCLSLRACRISDDGICKMTKALTDIEALNMGQCEQVSDKSLLAVTNSFKNLRWIDLYGCPKITNEMVTIVRSSLPRCTFNVTLCDIEKP